MRFFWIVIVITGLTSAAALAQDADALRRQANTALAAQKWTEALKAYDKLIEMSPKEASLYQLRGSAHFKAGHIEESITDFDKYIELEPAAKISHWQRGISYYYAGRWDDGMAQFEGYQSFDSNDVENAVWRFMCQARKEGIPKAQKAMLKIGNDRRVPMRDVYELYVGNKKPDDVFAAARAGEPNKELLSRQLFYAHLYVGIWHELKGDKKQALEHMNKAAEEYRIGHYMGDVARVHRDILRRELKKKEGG